VIIEFRQAVSVHVIYTCAIVQAKSPVVTVILTSKNKTVPYLRSGSHNLTLTCKSTFYDDCNFISRTIFSNVY